ncbi:Rieske 2Fe-2S domain-containing protein [Kineococcus sp. T13]|uniref:Rieske 2Fe-2S domain-containing protein n=1 Tax=Kineococcus vitellinus TaxID=2696565 RepID=UPI001412FDE1|nr:Rieske 2Fe-2S domain-containing protein [Kineococcus vitellinus]
MDRTRRTPHAPTGAALSRRRAIAAAGALGGASALAACGADEDAGGGAASGAPSATSSSATSSAAPTTSASPAPSVAAAAALTALSAVPVGSAVVVEASDGVPVVVARPADAEVVGFSARCTHQGCAVVVAGAELDCPCHGSRFDLLTGAVLAGPATDPLTPFAVRVEGEAVVAQA